MNTVAETYDHARHLACVGAWDDLLDFVKTSQDPLLWQYVVGHMEAALWGVGAVVFDLVKDNLWTIVNRGSTTIPLVAMPILGASVWRSHRLCVCMRKDSGPNYKVEMFYAEALDGATHYGPDRFKHMRMCAHKFVLHKTNKPQACALINQLKGLGIMVRMDMRDYSRVPEETLAPKRKRCKR